jgi:hypothetical protein
MRLDVQEATSNQERTAVSAGLQAFSSIIYVAEAGCDKGESTVVDVV